LMVAEAAQALREIVASGKAGRNAASLCKAESLIRAAGLLESARCVLVVTGFYVPSAKAPETDGPPGAAVLARSLRRIGVWAKAVTDCLNLEPLAACCDILGLDAPLCVRSPEEILSFEPDVLVFVERLGAAVDGCYYNMRGEDITRWTANLDEAACLAMEKYIPVVAVGDGGNEAGMGCLEEELKRLMPNFARCLCRVRADVVIPVDVSNWGAYALSGLLSVRTGRWLGHGPDEEGAMIEGMIKRGAVDGLSCLPTASVDGMPLEVHQETVARIQEVCERYMAKKGVGTPRAKL